MIEAEDFEEISSTWLFEKNLLLKERKQRVRLCGFLLGWALPFTLINTKKLGAHANANSECFSPFNSQ
jgi:hypothetical protein